MPTTAHALAPAYIREHAQTVLFGDKSDWNEAIGTHLDEDLYCAEFARLSEVDVSQFDCVVPLTLADYGDLEPFQHLAGRTFLNPSRDLVRLCHDKLSLNRFLLETGHSMLVPAMYAPGRARYPYIMKRRKDQWGMNSYIVRNEGEEREHADLLEDPDYFLQECIAGTHEYATHILAMDGEILFGTTVVSETSSEFYVKGARSAPSGFRLARDPGLVDAFAGVVSAIGYTGTCCIDYKIAEGTPRIFEINPRFGWSLHMDINRYLEAYFRALRP